MNSHKKREIIRFALSYLIANQSDAYEDEEEQDEIPSEEQLQNLHDEFTQGDHREKMAQIATKMTDEIMFISGINQPAKFITPSLEFQKDFAGSYNRHDFIEKLTDELMRNARHLLVE